MKGLKKLVFGLIVGVVCFVPIPVMSEAPKAVTVFAAASLTNALQAAADTFTEKTGTRTKLSFASSSTLAKQIEAGAGAQIFLSADESWMDYVEKRNLLATDTRRSLLGNGLVLIVPSDTPLEVRITSDPSWLNQFPEGRIAVGDPAHVPAGKYAKQALTHLGVWDVAAPRLARADNVRNALVLVERGEAVAGIVYSTDAAISKGVKIAARFPENSHKPISYPVALLRGHETGEARAFYEFLQTEEARAIFLSFGFHFPGGSYERS